MQKTKIARIIPAVILAGLILFNLWFIISQYWLIDSDMAQEMLLARHLNDTRRIISADWVYTTELRVYNINLFFRIGLYLFPNNWMYARVFGSMCVYLLFLLSIYLLFDACENKEYWMYAGIMLMIPVSTMYWFLGLFGLCYVFYAANILIVISCILKRSKSRIILASIISFLLGLNGVKLFLLFYAPLIVVCIGLLLKSEDHTMRQGSMIGCIASVSNIIGMLINFAFFNNYHYYHYSNITFVGNQWDASLHLNSFADKLLDFLTLFGYQGGAKLVSFAGITTIVCGLTLLMVVLTWKKTNKRNPVSNQEMFISFTALSMIAVDCIAFTLLEASYNSSYWIPAFIIIICVFITRFKANKRVIIITMIVFLLSGVATLKRNIETPMRGRPGLQEVTGWLVKNGYKRGYAQFWDADASVELSSGKLEIWSVDDLNNFSSITWGQSFSHFSEIPDRPFVIVRKGEWFDAGQYPEFSVQYETDAYTVYGGN